MENFKKYFAGANTNLGFYNLFDNILEHNKDSFLYILKGGPGTGKSTLLKKIAREFSNYDDIELFYCSSDTKSLDGIRLVKNNIAIVDGTAPHESNSKIAGITDKIINLGENISLTIKRQEERIKALINKKATCFKVAYSYLKIAGEIYNINNTLLLNTLIKDSIIEKTNNLSKNLKLKLQNKNCSYRELFLNVFEKEDSNFLNQNYNNIKNITNNQLINENIFSNILTKLKSLNYDLIIFKNLLNPKSISAIYIKELNLLLNRIDENPNNYEIHSNESNIKKYIKIAINYIEKAKKIHHQLEKIYIKKTNFKKINEVTKNLINEIKSKIQ